MCLSSHGRESCRPSGPSVGFGERGSPAGPAGWLQGCPRGKATTSGRPSRSRPRAPSGALAAPEGPRKAASPGAGGPALGWARRQARGFPQAEAAAVLSRIAAATVEPRAGRGRRVLTVPPPGPGAPSRPSCPPAVWMMSPCPAASGAPAPSILRCSPHGNLERTGCHGWSRGGAGSPQKPQGRPPLLGPHPSIRARPRAGGGSGSPRVPLSPVP